MGNTTLEPEMIGFANESVTGSEVVKGKGMVPDQAGIRCPHIELVLMKTIRTGNQLRLRMTHAEWNALGASAGWMKKQAWEAVEIRRQGNLWVVFIGAQILCRTDQQGAEKVKNLIETLMRDPIPG